MFSKHLQAVDWNLFDSVQRFAYQALCLLDELGNRPVCSGKFVQRLSAGVACRSRRLQQSIKSLISDQVSKPEAKFALRSLLGKVFGSLVKVNP